MRRFTVAMAVVLLAVAVPSVYGGGGGGDSDFDDSDVLKLTKDNFDAALKANELILVEFFAPWCGHCKSLAPKFAQAATALKRNDPPIPLATVDATEHGEIAGRYGVSGYPTLFVFRDGKESKYEGDRTAEGIASYMRKQVGPAAKPLSSKSEIEKFIKSDKDTSYAVVGFFGSSASQLQSAFVLVAQKLRTRFVFGKVTSAELLKEYGVEGEAVIAFKDFDEGKAVFEGQPKTKNLEDWVQQHSIPVVGEITSANAQQYTQRGLPVGKFFMQVDKDKGSKHHKYYTNRLRKAADAFSGKITIAYADNTAFANERETLGLKDAEIGFVIEDGQDKYLFEEKFTADSLIAFIQKFVDDDLEPWVQSEPVPASNNGPVKVVVGKTFEDIVEDPEQDVLIEFYAPWCGHCKALTPKYEELGKKVAHVPTLTIAKIDATANHFDRSRYNVGGYPTIYFKPAKENAKPIQYDGEREVDAFLEFIQKKAKNKFELKDGGKKKKKKKAPSDS